MERTIHNLIDSGVIEDLSIEKLNCANSQLTSLDGIEKLVNLKILSCPINKIKSLRGVEKLLKLEVLNCNYNQLTSLEGVENLIKLKELHCHSNELIFLDHIENLHNLEEFFLSKNKITSNQMKHLYKLEKLTYIDFSDNPCSSILRTLDARAIVKKAKTQMIKTHLTHTDDKRGEASMMDTGLFDFIH